MRVVSLMYHDIFDFDALEGFGFSEVAADRYNVKRSEFQAHMAALDQHLTSGVSLAPDVLRTMPAVAPVMLTFDDGGLSAYTIVMDVLERYGWKAHFFIVTDWIGKPGYLDVHHLRTLRARGHVIGSHSCSHPSRMASMSLEAISQEWVESVARLSEVLGEEITTASVPGGDYSPLVALAAAAAGIQALFTSEPVRTVQRVGTCMVFGRYAVLSRQRGDQNIRWVKGETASRYRAYLLWNLRKAARRVGREGYLRLRLVVLFGRYYWRRNFRAVRNRGNLYL